MYSVEQGEVFAYNYIKTSENHGMRRLTNKFLERQ